MKNYILMILFLLLSLQPCLAQWENQQTYGTAAPSVSFQSTSTMQGSGSTYASNPSINGNGTAAYAAPSYAPSGQRRTPGAPGTGTGTPTTPGNGDPQNQFPLGDGTGCLLFLLALYAAATGWRRYKRQQLGNPSPQKRR